VPQDCRSAVCRVHVAFHGCRQNAEQIGRRFVEGAGYNAWADHNREGAGYNAWADHNRIIVLYPQTVPRRGLALGSWKWVYNPSGCWDWWGYSGSAYATRDGLQIAAVRAMLKRLAAPRQR